MVVEDGRRVEEGRLPGEEDICDVALVSKYQSEALGGTCGTLEECSAA
jgi:hypothetical protein